MKYNLRIFKYDKDNEIQECFYYTDFTFDKLVSFVEGFNPLSYDEDKNIWVIKYKNFGLSYAQAIQK